MKYLVLGSAGQIGLSLVRFLKSNNLCVSTLDIANSPQEDLRVLTPHIENSIKDADFIYFLAYDVGGSRYLADKNNDFDLIYNNSQMMSVVFSLIKKYNKKFIFASSQMATMGHSSYGACKLLGEHFTKTLKGKIVKFWNVYGEEHDEKKFHVITDFIKKAQTTGVIDMLTTGDEERQFLYADDCSECLYTLSLRYDDISQDTNLHITNFKWTTIKEVAEVVASFFNNIVIIPGNKKDNVQNSIKNHPDTSILAYWQPKTDLHQGIKKVIQSYTK